MFIDAHSHWSDLRLSQDQVDIETRLRMLRSKEIGFFMQAGVEPADWQRQLELKKISEESFGLCVGLHPYKVSEIFKNKKISEVEDILDQLTLLLPQSLALGETGLDFREAILGLYQQEEAVTFQIEMFENQIQLAKAFKKPLVLHIVKAHEKALQILEMWREHPKSYSGLVHAFTGSYEIARRYIDLGFLISVGTAVTYNRNTKLHKTVQMIPLESLVIETDYPDQPPEGVGGLNQPESLLKVAEKIAELRGISLEKVKTMTSTNFQRVFSVKPFS